MALHSELPIYKVTYDLIALVLQLARNMPRDVKQQIGGALREDCFCITRLIYRANVARDKGPHLLEVIELVQVVELMLRLAHDLRWIAPKHYARAPE